MDSLSLWLLLDQNSTREKAPSFGGGYSDSLCRVRKTYAVPVTVTVAVVPAPGSEIVMVAEPAPLIL